jgi:hypothetical protein
MQKARTVDPDAPSSWITLIPGRTSGQALVDIPEGFRAGLPGPAFDIAVGDVDRGAGYLAEGG